MAFNEVCRVIGSFPTLFSNSSERDERFKNVMLMMSSRIKVLSEDG